MIYIITVLVVGLGLSAACTYLEGFIGRKEESFMNGQRIKIRYAVDGLEKIKKISQGDWIDLRCAEDVHMVTGEFRLLSLGVAMELPDGYEAHVVPRSSTFKNFGIILTNSTGIIDSTFRGDEDIWRFPAYALRDTDIKKNDRICQFRIVKKQPKIEFEEVETLGNENRGGIGSTGRS